MHKVKTNKTQMCFSIFSILNTTEMNPLQILYQSEYQYDLRFNSFSRAFFFQKCSIR